MLLGFKRVLTSGQEESAEKGTSQIKKMVELVGDSISIMIGAGVNKDNVANILKLTGAREYHGSARVSKESTVALCKPKMGVGDVPVCAVTDAEHVAKMVQAAERILSQEVHPKSTA